MSDRFAEIRLAAAQALGESQGIDVVGRFGSRLLCFVQVSFQVLREAVGVLDLTQCYGGLRQLNPGTVGGKLEEAGELAGLVVSAFPKIYWVFSRSEHWRHRLTDTRRTAGYPAAMKPSLLCLNRGLVPFQLFDPDGLRAEHACGDAHPTTKRGTWSATFRKEMVAVRWTRRRTTPFCMAIWRTGFTTGAV